MQSLQARFNELNAGALAFRDELLKRKKLSGDEYELDFQSIEIVKKPVKKEA